MKLTAAQKVVLAAIAVMMLLLLADVVDIINMPNVVVLAALPLAMVAYFVLPSLEQIKRRTRRR